jgi:polyhydroxyalkanoate synthesis repressor PhaR
VRLIKRYANRKLYDTTASTYITLDEIAQMIKSGDEIQIIDNKSKEDLTAVTMAQILVEEEKRERRGDGASSLAGLRDLIQHNTALLSRRITQPVTSIRTSVEESVTKLIRSGEERVAETREQVQEFIDGLDPLGRLQHDMVELRARVEYLEAKLAEAESASDADR